jgi:hypothetical protein
MTHVSVFKEGREMGWFKDLNGGILCVKNTCEMHGFDINMYYITEKDDHKNILWKGSDEADLDINTRKE